MNIAPYRNSDVSGGDCAVNSNDTHRSSKGSTKSFQQRIGEVHPSFWGYRYVIFPESPAAQLWDSIIIIITFYNALWIPYEFGISGGYLKMTSRGFIAFNAVVDVCFLVDTFLHFFRAYYDQKGYLVYSLVTIRKKYIRSGWFFFNILSSIPTSLLVYAGGGGLEHDMEFTQWDDMLFLLDIFKLLRLFRLRRLMKTSFVFQSYLERTNVKASLILKFMSYIGLLAHWIACIWGLIAFAEAGLSFGDELLTSTNWISNWYKANNIAGGINPIGWENPWDRYFLCLFWSIQSITSIGYGNVIPVTLSEYVLANFLMLICGIFWAYIIGSFVEAVSSMGSVNKEYERRMNQANQMFSDFLVKDLPISENRRHGKKTSNRVKRFLTKQRDRSTKNWLDNQNATTLSERYPTLDILSPGLQTFCALHLLHPLINKVPYLSLKYLTPEEQADVAMRSVNLEFSSGEQFTHHHELGRGILIFRQGFGFSSRNVTSHMASWHRCSAKSSVEVNEVLVEDDWYNENHIVFYFVGFSQCLFIPRSVIMDVLSRNERAWKESARWRYFKGCLLRKHFSHLSVSFLNHTDDIV